LASVLDTQKVGCHTRVATIAVWKWVNTDQSVVEPHSNICQRKGPFSELKENVVAHLLDLDGYVSPRNADGLVRSPKLASPSPGPVEHPQMESLQAVTTY